MPLREYTEPRQACARRSGGAVASRDGGGSGIRLINTWVEQNVENINLKLARSFWLGRVGKCDKSAAGYVNRFCCGAWYRQHKTIFSAVLIYSTPQLHMH